ncbi:MAG: hypothetical protein HXY40_16840, partial [Chloroflexi bacterium]|nr:hypothetical protein [Chloroflexota bacterium]
MYAEIAVDVAVKGTFAYHIPPSLAGKIAPGHLVEVSFRTAVQPGIVVELNESTAIAQTKPVRDLLDPQPVVTPAQIALARWMSSAYQAPLSACLWLMLPPGISGARDVLLRLRDPAALSPDDAEQAVLDLLRTKGTRKGSQLATALPGVHWRPAVDALVKEGLIEREPILTPPRVKPKIVQTAALAVAPEQIGQIIFGKRLSAETTARLHHILRLLARAGQPLDVSALYAQTGAALADLQRLAAAGLVALGERESLRDPLAERDFVLTSAPVLTAEQQAAWAAVEARLTQMLTPPPDP